MNEQTKNNTLFLVDIEFLFSCFTQYLTSESSEQERYRLTPIDRAVRKASDASKLIILILYVCSYGFVKARNLEETAV